LKRLVKVALGTALYTAVIAVAAGTSLCDAFPPFHFRVLTTLLRSGVTASVFNSSNLTKPYIVTAFWSLLPPCVLPPLLRSPSSPAPLLQIPSNLTRHLSFRCYGLSLYTTIATRRTVDASLGVHEPSPPRWNASSDPPRHMYTNALTSSSSARDVVTLGRAPLRELPPAGMGRKKEEKEGESSKEGTEGMV
jgi:hypothetical protein